MEDVNAVFTKFNFWHNRGLIR